VLEVVEIFRGKVIDVDKDSLIVEAAGTSDAQAEEN
jgi:acetolactate synthase small subunit